MEVQACVILPELTAFDNEYVVDVMFRGSKMRSLTKAVNEPVYVETMCAATIYI
jgi:hypothetical protein